LRFPLSLSSETLLLLGRLQIVADTLRMISLTVVARKGHRVMRTWWIGLSFVVALAAVTGCGPQVSREELGEVVFELPKVPPSQPAANAPSATNAPAVDSQPPRE
jgi:hypothetical protein